MDQTALTTRDRATPLPFDPKVEKPAPNERAAIESINRNMAGILRTTAADYGHSVRSVHAKSHGLLAGTLQVLEGLPPALAQGMFAKPATYPVVLRLSTNPGDILDDTISSPRGLAVKVIGVEGARLPGSEGATTQDFVMANSPAFVAPDAKAFGQNLTLLAATTDTGQAWKKALSGLLRGAARALTAAGAGAGSLKALGGHPLTHPLGETFYTQTPFRYGDHIAKIAVAPVSPELTSLTDAPVDVAGRPNGLRAAVIDFFGAHDGEWEVRVQLRTNPETMPIEDASVPWPEAESPYVAVARITVPRQPAWSEDRAAQVDDAMAFSPWRGLDAHRPLGSINRARREAYPLSARFRAQHNGCPIHEPKGAPDLADAAPAVFGRTPGREGRRPGTPDAVPGMVGQPLNATARTLTAGAVGGFAAGALLSVMLSGVAAAEGGPSDLVRLQRRTMGRLGRVARPGWREQAAAHGGHLALSAVSGVAFAAAKPRDMSPVLAGGLFGAAYYAVAHGMIGPALGVSPKLTRDTTSSIAQHSLFHLLFGITTAVVADKVAKRI